jgi:rare lipoprotein A
MAMIGSPASVSISAQLRRPSAGVLLLLSAAAAGWAPALVVAADGIASYYGGRFHGRLTASGARFNQHALTAAHRKLRFGTRVRVTHARNGRSVVVTINDRGPYARGRVIDLSRAAAAKLGMLQSGVAPVRLEVLKPTSAKKVRKKATKRPAAPPRNLWTLFGSSPRR